MKGDDLGWSGVIPTTKLYLFGTFRFSHSDSSSLSPILEPPLFLLLNHIPNLPCPLIST